MTSQWLRGWRINMEQLFKELRQTDRLDKWTHRSFAIGMICWFLASIYSVTLESPELLASSGSLLILAAFVSFSISRTASAEAESAMVRTLIDLKEQESLKYSMVFAAALRVLYGNGKPESGPESFVDILASTEVDEKKQQALIFALRSMSLRRLELLFYEVLAVTIGTLQWGFAALLPLPISKNW